MKVIKTSVAAAVFAAISVTSALAEEVVWTKGVIKKVDLAQSKVTVKHEEITNLEMPSMTMVFFAPDAKVLEGLKAGQAREFEFGDLNGRMVVKQVK